MNNLYIIFGNVCTYAGAIGTVIFLVLCVIVACTKINLPGGEKKFVEMIIALVIALIMFFAGLCVRDSGGYISQNYDWIKKSERNNLVRDCPEDSTMTSYCAFKWKEYRIDSTKAAEDMRKYLEKK
jgi:amino acid permease